MTGPSKRDVLTMVFFLVVCATFFVVFLLVTVGVIRWDNPSSTQGIAWLWALFSGAFLVIVATVLYGTLTGQLPTHDHGDPLKGWPRTKTR